jgi:DNA/RNA endonuclease G (NUC1)
MPNATRPASRTRLFIFLFAALFGICLFLHQVYFARRVQAVSSTVVISEFRTVGPSGGNDEFIELYNLTNAAVDISGWTIRGSNATAGVSIRLTVSTGTSIPAHGHFLATNSAASGYSGSVPGNQTYATGITNDGGIALFNASATIIDQVGMSAGSAYKEGTVLTPLTTNTNRGYERKPGGANGSTQDTDNNSTDFQLLTPSDPQNLSSAPTPSTNQAINTTCPNPPSTTEGTATSAAVSATDPDGIVTTASITSAPVVGITLDSFAPAGAVGGTASATLNIANTTAAGTYNVAIQWSNNDSPTPQTATCNVVVTVTPPNQPIAPSCPASLNATQGTATSTGVSASDPDGTVTSASITSAPVAGITLDGFTPAVAVGGTASATLNVANTTAVGNYNVTIQYSNNDSPTPQTASCTVAVNVQPPPPAAGSVVISQVYGGGGNAGATLKNDFIEIINHTGAPINLAGWSVQYISATATTGSWAVTPLNSFMLQPGQYYLVQEAAGTGGTVDLPTADTVGTIPMGATAGKVALVSNTTALSGVGCPGAGVVDLVGYGGTANCFEGAGPTAVLTNTTADLRKDNGCTDTDNNNSDFSTGAPNPRNTLSPTNNCAVLKGTGSANPFGVQQGESTTLTVVVSPGSDPTSTGITVTADLSSIGGSPTQSFAGSGNTFTFFATVAPATPLGNKLLPVTITDDQARIASTTIALVVQQPHIVISQIYGGGGNASATYTNDFVELYNPTSVDFDLTGWSLQYSSATADGWEFTRQPLGGTIEPGQYYLIALGSGGATGLPLPAANINSDINISSTSGKLALVNDFEPLEGNCPIGDVNIQDFVGYGSADCSETANAVGPSNNTTALFRKNDGATDTDSNSADFITGTPNPRRTAIIVELGPSVFGTDPRNNGANAARDASMTITFTEPVSVVDPWFDITCASGQHNSATFASTNGGKTHVITPNVNFVPGEQCTVTIFKDQIHDLDLDDSGPNSDTLAANKVWTFTVSTGTAPPYPSSVHLTMGDPGCGTAYGCAAASLGSPNNFLMDKPEFTISYNRDKGAPNWVSWHLTDEWIGSLTRVDTFRPDPGVPDTWYRVQAFDFSGSGFDRGHMTPNADRDKETSIPINQATFLMSNMVAQAPDNNQGPWADLEGYLRTLLPSDEVYIVSGPFGVGGTGSNGGVTTTLAGGNVTVPAQTWKVALVIPKASGDDISRVSCSSRTIAVILPNIQGIRNTPWENYLTTVDAVEQLTGYDFFSNLPPAVQACVEGGVNGTNPPGTANQSANTTEDNAVIVTLQALQANNNTLTFSIVNGPTSGSLGSVSAASCASGTCTATVTYTPGADFNGPDSFTFRAADGSLNSNTSTVSVGVSEVNDSPVASNDSKTTQEDTQLSFASSNLTGNDSAGPANEAAQSLTVASVTSDANTHGTVTLESGMVTYTPAANFNGPASFTYSVCDDGTTNGSPDPKCATGTVNVTVNAVNDAPDAVNDSATIAEDSGANLISVLGNDTDTENDTLTVSAVTQGAHGSVTNNGSSVSYTPVSNFFGTDNFTYTANDGHGGTDTATVNITINNVNDAPVLTSSVAVSLIASTNSNLINVGLTASATDQEGETVTIQVAVFGDEDDQSATMPGVVHSPDAKDIAPNTLRLRGERVEANDGRVYLIVVTATDTSGGVSRNYHTVVVPKNNKPASVMSINNQAAAAIAYAQSHGGAPPVGYFVIGDGPIIGPKQ